MIGKAEGSTTEPSSSNGSGKNRKTACRYVVRMAQSPQSSVVTRRMNVIGIGAGAASFVTAEAAEAIADTDVFVVIDKGSEKADLVGVRRELLDRFARSATSSKPFREVVIEDGQRDDRPP